METERLWLCEWEEGDSALFLPIAQDPRVMRFITGGEPWLDPQVREFVARQMAWQDQLGYCMWKLLLKQNGRLVGFCGLQPLCSDTPPKPDEIRQGFVKNQETEVGYWLAAEQWGKGLATEAARRALKFAFEERGMDRVVAICRPANVASSRVMEKMGMTKVGDAQYRGIEVVKYEINHSR